MRIVSVTRHLVSLSNLTPQEKQALAEPNSNQDIVIKPAGKESAVVIQNREDHMLKGLHQLNDLNYYTEVPHNLTTKHNTDW